MIDCVGVSRVGGGWIWDRMTCCSFTFSLVGHLCNGE